MIPSARWRGSTPRQRDFNPSKSKRNTENKIEILGNYRVINNDLFLSLSVPSWGGKELLLPWNHNLLAATDQVDAWAERHGITVDPMATFTDHFLFLVDSNHEEKLKQAFEAEG